MAAITIDSESPHADYFEGGLERAARLDNRGPIRFDDDGNLAPEILEAYSRCGCYVFENVVSDTELNDLRVEVEDALSRAPVSLDATVDAQGRPALGVDSATRVFITARPLSDPVGGTEKNNGRHPSKMEEPPVPEDAPERVPYLMFGTLEHIEACLRVYGHPDLLRIADQLNGPDFTPFNEALFIKDPGLGASVAWHRDGTTHWDSPDWDEGSHGFNFMIQLYGSTPGNGVWVVPGTHKLRHCDIKAMVDENGGSDKLPDAVPLVCGPGDAFICNRQLMHGSFANTSPDRRVTVNFGFQRRSKVLGMTGSLISEGQFYDEEYIAERSRCIPLAIDARAQRYPDEKPYHYAPLADRVDENRYTPEARTTILKDYNLRDLAI